jgi:hypothetical protein
MFIFAISAAMLAQGVAQVDVPFVFVLRDAELSCPTSGQPDTVLAGAAAEASRQLTDFPVETSAEEKASFARIKAAFNACDVKYAWQAGRMYKSAQLNLLSSLALRHIRATFGKRGVSFKTHDHAMERAYNDVTFDVGPEMFVTLADDLRRQGLKEPADEPADISNIYLSLFAHEYSSRVAFSSPEPVAP